MKFPTVFVNHGGGPLPLLGRQPRIAKHMREVVENWLPKEKPSAIVMLSAHWESDPVKISSSPNPSMLYDYSGFPPETYKYKYEAPGSPELANRIQNLLEDAGIRSELDGKRGYDHGVFVPLMLMYPDADIPVVCVSLDDSMSAERNIRIGSALASLRDEGVLILGSGYTFHNMQAFFHPSDSTFKASVQFNDWLKETLLHSDSFLEKLKDWDKAPGGRLCHPREEHLLPLLMTAAAAGSDTKPKLIFDAPAEDGNHAVSAYLFN